MVLTAGVVTTAIGTTNVAHDHFIEPDGDIVVVGYSRDADTDATLTTLRYKTTGELGGSFGDSGVVQTSIGRAGDYAKAAAPYPVDNPQKIVVAGNAHDSYYGSADFAVARYNQDGSLDPTFGGKAKKAGFARTHVNYQDNVQDVVVQPDGNIVVAGSASMDPGDLNEFTLLRYTPAGKLDSTFAGGIVQIDLPGGSSYIRQVVMHQGKILAVGHANSDTTTDIALVRYNLVVVGTVEGNVPDTGAPGGMAVACYTPEGALDTTFGEELDGGSRTGFVTLNLAAAGFRDAVWSGQNATAVVIDSSDPNDPNDDDKILVAGDALIDFPVEGSQTETYRVGVFVVARFDQYGNLDTTFGEERADMPGVRSGMAIIDFFDQTGSRASDMALDAQDRIVVVGHAHHPVYDAQQFAVARFLPDGTPDPDFGEDTNGDGVAGTVVTGILRGADATTVSIQDNGKIVVAGFADTGLADPVPRRVYTVIRYQEDGMEDPELDANNLPPVTNADGIPDDATTDENTPVTIAVLANDLDPEGSTLAGILVKDAANTPHRRRR